MKSTTLALGLYALGALAAPSWHYSADDRAEVQHVKEVGKELYFCKSGFELIQPGHHQDYSLTIENRHDKRTLGLLDSILNKLKDLVSKLWSDYEWLKKEQDQKWKEYDLKAGLPARPHKKDKWHKKEKGEEDVKWNEHNDWNKKYEDKKKEWEDAKKKGDKEKENKCKAEMDYKKGQMDKRWAEYLKEKAEADKAKKDRDQAWKDYEDAKNKCDAKKKEYDAKKKELDEKN